MISFSPQLELFPDEKIIVQPYKSLKTTDIKSIQETFKAQGGGAIFLNAELIISIKHILIALNKAFSKRQGNTDKGKEIVQLLATCLIPEKTPKDLTFNFVQTDLTKPSILVAHLPKDKDVNLKDHIKGEEADLDSIGENVNFDLVKKVYGIEKAELDLDTDLRGSIYNQVALKQLR